MTDWREIIPGDVIQGKDNHAWDVIGIDGDRISLTRAGAKPFVGTRPKGPVTRLLTMRQVQTRALALVEDRLGGEVTAVTRDSDLYLVPVEYSEPGTLHAHVYLLHGRRLTDTDHLPTLQQEHAAFHAPRMKHGMSYVEHHHTPDFARKVQT